MGKSISRRKHMQKENIIKVSVIVPIYNVDKYLKKCLDTLINQTLKEIEIICVNDGSTDTSEQILSEYAERDSRIIVIKQENKGLSVARNTGMAIAKGEFIGLVDSDDWVELNYFEKLFEVAKKYDADIACCGFSRIYESSRTRAKVKISHESVYETVAEKYRVANIPRMCYVFNKIYKRLALEEIKLTFKPGVYFEDVAFTIRALFYLKKMAITPSTHYCYRANEDSIMRGEQTDKKQIDILEARKDFIDFASKHYIKCDDKYFIQRKIVHKFCNIPLMKICVWETVRKYYLFGLIKIWETRHSV